MKKKSSNLAALVVVLLISLTTSSCTRKMGCYFGQTQNPNLSGRIVSSGTNSEYDSEQSGNSCSDQITLSSNEYQCKT